MASITKQPNGRRIVQVVCPDGKRRSLRLGKVSTKIAEGVKTHIEHLVSANATGQSVDLHTSRWLADISDDLHEKIVKLGMAKPRASVERRTISQVIKEHGEKRVDVKPATRDTWKQSHSSFVSFVGANRFIDEISAADADDWEQSLISSGLSRGTVRKRVRVVKALMNWAIKREYLDRSPLIGLSSTSHAGAEKPHITREDAFKVLERLPNSQWRLFFALGRFGGLRLPSEAYALRWSMVDWENDRITVPVPKLEHIPGKDKRIIPIFADLRDYLLTAFEEAEPGDDRVITLPKSDPGRRKVVIEAIEAAGLEKWSHLFHSLRASCETDLMKDGHSPAAVCRWIGHSLAVSERHYLQITDDCFARAAAPKKSVQEPVQYPDVTPSAESSDEVKNDEDSSGRRQKSRNK